MTPQSPFRDAAARRDAIRIYRLAADQLGDEEQHLAGTASAEVIHVYALRAMRALVAEIDDPKPKDDPWCHCIGCEAYIAAPSVLKVVPLDEAML